MKGGDFCYRCAFIERNKDDTLHYTPYCTAKTIRHSPVTGEPEYELAYRRRNTWPIFGGCNGKNDFVKNTRPYEADNRW